jgi:hypothetical protein
VTGEVRFAGKTNAERAAERRRIRVRVLDRALDDIDRPGRSMKCSGEFMPYGRRLHAGTPGGCANDGSSCICECHDIAEESA